MLLSSLNTGSTDLRDTEVQQPNTAATLSLVRSSRAFSAKSGQSDAGSTTTASSFLPSSPPFLFCSSMSIRTVSFSVVSLMAIVPDSEWSTPTLIVAWADAALEYARPAASSAAARNVCFSLMFQLLKREIAWMRVRTMARSHLQLNADAELLRVGLHGVKALVEIKDHHARIELLDDVVEIQLRGFLVVIGVDGIQPVGKVGFRELPENFPFARAHCGGEEIARQDVTARVGGVPRVVAAKLVVLRKLRFEREGA